MLDLLAIVGVTTSPSCSWELPLPEARQENETHCLNSLFSKRQLVSVSKGTWSGVNTLGCQNTVHLSQKEFLIGKWEKGLEWSVPVAMWPQVQWPLHKSSSPLSSNGFELRSRWVILPSLISTSGPFQFWAYLVISDETCYFLMLFAPVQFFWCLITWRESQGSLGAGKLSGGWGQGAGGQMKQKAR